MNYILCQKTVYIDDSLRFAFKGLSHEIAYHYFCPIDCPIPPVFSFSLYGVNDHRMIFCPSLQIATVSLDDMFLHCINRWEQDANYNEFHVRIALSILALWNELQVECAKYKRVCAPM